MQPRTALLAIFSTFLQFETDHVHTWASDSKLRRSMQIQLEQSSQRDLSAKFWSLYWHKLWRAESQPDSQKVSAGHLSAYLQETCYWTAQKTAARFSSSRYGVSDYFQIAMAQVDKLLKGFNSDQGFNLQNYASATFASLMRETLRQRREIDICSDWALLRKLSQKRLVEALKNNGVPQETIDRYVLAWTSFKAIYVPQQATGTQKLEKPAAEVWIAIATQYNQERTQLLPNATAITVADLEAILMTCAKAARAYLYPAQISINTPRPGQDAGEFLDQLPNTEQASLLEEMIATETIQTRQNQHQQIGKVLIAAIQDLDQPSQSLLQLYYSQAYTQQQIAEKLEMKQYTISRRLTKLRKTLLTALATWSQDTLHISPDSDVLKAMSSSLEEWLTGHYGEPAPTAPALE
ncbi:sigma-70 family RNA polymerase sigma factor [Acaryochloris marina NIES-2412]|uniref:sigma-70 family RNA polymerase sigma factor n=1 Tax=Acaryochloris marina TaxID=155978 RepID=UPI004059000D